MKENETAYAATQTEDRNNCNCKFSEEKITTSAQPDALFFTLAIQLLLDARARLKHHVTAYCVFLSFS